MLKHRTASLFVTGAYLELQEAVLRALPKDIDDITALRWADDEDSLSQGLRSLLMLPELAKNEIPLGQLGGAAPSNDEVFSLTLDGAIDGLEFVSLFGYDPKGWSYKGQPMTGSLTRQFKIVGVGNCSNLEECRSSLALHGDIPHGQWLQAFRQSYTQKQGKNPIGIADPSWAGPGDDVRFPVLHIGRGWKPQFDWASGYRGAHGRWLVEVK